MKNSYDSLIFDLDGTLWDMSSFSTKAWNKVLEKQNLPLISEKELTSVTGLPFEECVSRLIDISPKDLEDLKAKLDIEERNVLIGESGILYPGVIEGLFELKKTFRLFLVSNCQSWYLQNFIDHCKASQYFEDFECIGNTGQPKDQNILNIVERNNLKDPVYIGDTHTDQKAAEKANVFYVHLDHGFGEPTTPCPRFSDFQSLVETFLG